MAFLPRTADRVWLHSFAAIVPPLIEAFRPQVIVAQHGADPHRSDPLADLSLSVDAMALAQRLVIDLADRFADGRWIGVGGGYHRDDTACVPKGGQNPAKCRDGHDDDTSRLGVSHMEHSRAASCLLGA